VAVPLLAAGLAALVFAGVLSDHSPLVLVSCAVLLAGSVFAAVHHAEVLAARVGEPFGSIILAVAITVIEVALIVSIMLSGALGNEQVARDTVFSAVMLVLNGVIGLCLILGARRHFEQNFQLNAATAALAVLGTLATLALILPNYAVAGPQGEYSPIQLLVVGVVSIWLYGVFIFVQTIRHRDYFLDAGELGEHVGHAVPAARTTAASALLLPLALAAVILLAKVLSHPLDDAVEAAGLPQSFVGVIIAAVILLPEGIASVRSALLNRLQNSINLALGSALASIGLTIPVVGAISLVFGIRVELGLSPEHMVFLVLTLFVATLTLGTGRTTVLQGAVHLAIFVAFILFSAVP